MFFFILLCLASHADVILDPVTVRLNEGFLLEAPKSANVSFCAAYLPNKHHGGDEIPIKKGVLYEDGRINYYGENVKTDCGANITTVNITTDIGRWKIVVTNLVNENGIRHTFFVDVQLPPTSTDAPSPTSTDAPPPTSTDAPPTQAVSSVPRNETPPALPEVREKREGTDYQLYYYVGAALAVLYGCWIPWAIWYYRKNMPDEKAVLEALKRDRDEAEAQSDRKYQGGSGRPKGDFDSPIASPTTLRSPLDSNFTTFPRTQDGFSRKEFKSAFLTKRSGETKWVADPEVKMNRRNIGGA